MSSDPYPPKLRPVEARPSRAHPGSVEIFDRSGISPTVLTLSGAALFIASKLDGRHSRSDIQAAFMRRHGSMLFSEDLEALLQQLDEAKLLASHAFDAHMAGLTAEYRRAPHRSIRDIGSFEAPPERLGDYFDDMLKDGTPGVPVASANVVGLVAPHLDYARGAPCYAAAYAGLARRTTARRFVILGTNHFGRATSVVGTRKGFETPWGVVTHDEAFMRRMDARCGADLCEFEFDHAREHSIELQVLLLRNLLKGRDFSIAAYLCPDPCGSTGTAPADGRGVDLKQFAEALRDELAVDDVSTCVIAGADLSHLGRYFQDERDLSPAHLAAVEASDRAALGFIEKGEPEAFRTSVAATGNATNICSVGCLYTLATAMADGPRPRLMRYHQAVTQEQENCVTCCAIEYVADSR